MNIHEYQARELLEKNGVPIPGGGTGADPAQARKIAEDLISGGAQLLVVKSQIHAGGRGKGTFKTGFQGGVRFCRTATEVEDCARAMLGNVLVTKQTGPEGRLVRKVLVVTAPKIQRELYLAILLDRATSRPVIMASTEGGVEIEEVAAKTPEKITRESIDPAVGFTPYIGRKIAAGLRLHGDLAAQMGKVVASVYGAWWECDASLVEINPLCEALDQDGKPRLLAVDAKVVLDDNSLFRHPDFAAMRDLEEEAPLEVEASKHGLNYIKLDGNIACLVNGAGLAMATMDIIKHYGGQPANFLDVGGGATQEQVAAAFKIILQDAHVKAILVNIFGGIMDCNVIAGGIVQAVKETGLSLPLVVRLEGNNVEAGKQTLAQSGLRITNAESMSDAAQKVVAALPYP